MQEKSFSQQFETEGTSRKRKNGAKSLTHANSQHPKFPHTPTHIFINILNFI